MDNDYVLLIVESVGPKLRDEAEVEGRYLMYMDFEANNGTGQMCVTTDPERALGFDTAEEALEFWKTPSRTVPLRDDGRPNRPLTAFTVQITRRRPS